MNATVAYLSRQELGQIAQPIVSRYKDFCVPKYHLCYCVDPTKLANLLGYKVEYCRLSRDCLVLGQTATVPLWTTVMNDDLEEIYYYLDGKTILIEERLQSDFRAAGRKNFTIAHELAHLLLNQQYPSSNDLQCRHIYYRRKTAKQEVSNWYEWQADALAVELLLPPDAIESAMFLFGLGNKMKVLSWKYSPDRYEYFCAMAQFLGVSKTTLAYRMEQLGLLERNYLIEEAQKSRGGVRYGKNLRKQYGSNTNSGSLQPV